MPLLPGDELPDSEVMMEHLDPNVSLIHQLLERIDSLEARTKQLETIVTQLADLIHRVNT